MRYPKNDFGMAITLFTQRYGITKKELAAAAGVKPTVLYQVQIGKIPGFAIKEKVYAYMEQHEATHTPKPILTPFKEVNP